MVTAPTAVKGSNTVYDAANNVGVDDQAGNARFGIGGPGTQHDQLAIDKNVAFTDNTTGDVSSSKHGFAPKLSGNALTFLNGAGAYTAPAAGATMVSLAADFSYTKDAARHASLLAIATLTASTVYFVHGYFMWTGLADGGEQATFDFTLPTSASFLGNAHWIANTTPTDAKFVGTALGKASSGTTTIVIVDGLLTIDATHLTGFVVDFGDNSGAGTAVIAKGSYLSYIAVA